MFVYVDEDGRRQIYRVDFDDGSRTAVGAPDRSAESIEASASGKSLALRYEPNLVALGDGVQFSAAIALAESAVVTGGFHGEHLAYEVDDVEWHLLALDDGVVVDTRVSEADETGFGCMARYDEHPKGKAVFTHRSPGSGMVLLDLSEPVPQRLLHIEPSEAGATLSCPVWNPDGTAFVYTESGAQGDRLRRVNWSTGSPEAPATIYESTDDYRFYALMFVP